MFILVVGYMKICFQQDLIQKGRTTGKPIRRRHRQKLTEEEEKGEEETELSISLSSSPLTGRKNHGREQHKSLSGNT